jgi:rod shape-determining protein MreC
MVLVAISVLFMTLDHRFNQLQTLRSGISLLISPLQYVVDLPIRLASDATESLSSREHLLSENERLHQENLHLKALLQKFDALKNENSRLRDLMQASKLVEDHFQIAQIMSIDLDPYKQLVVINKGSQDDVSVGQPILDAQGVMGQIIEVSAIRSVAMLISDPSHALPVQVNRNGLRTLAVGTGNPALLELRFIPTSADIIEGDIVSTSGLGGRFPTDYPVARVTKIDRIPGEPFANIEAEPLAYLDRSREVLLVVTKEPEVITEEAAVEEDAEPASDDTTEKQTEEATSE